LSEVIKFLRKKIGDKDLEEDFRSSIWHRLADLLAESTGPSLETARSLPPLKGMRSSLREYQKLDAEWLLFLFER